MRIGDALAVVAHLAAVAVVVLRTAGSLFVAAALATDFVFIAQRLAGERFEAVLAVVASTLIRNADAMRAGPALRFGTA